MPKLKDDQRFWHMVPSAADKALLKYCMTEGGYSTLASAIRGALRSHARGLKRKKTLAAHRAKKVAKATGEQA